MLLSSIYSLVLNYGNTIGIKYSLLYQSVQFDRLFIML